MRMTRKSPTAFTLAAALIAMALLVSGCGPRWSYPVEGLPGGTVQFNRRIWKDYQDFTGEDGTVPLEQVLYGSGARLVETIVILTAEGESLEYDWSQTAETAALAENGSIFIFGQKLMPDLVYVQQPALEYDVQAGIQDIAPTAAGALGIPAPELSTGTVLVDVEAEAVLLLFLDGFGYVRFQEALDDGLVPNLASLDPPLPGLTTYPPITTVSTASMLTGTEPPRHGVETRGIRKTDAQTIFDTAAAAGLETAVVEGEALAFNIRNTDIDLSGDRDGNGSTDDNVLANALAVLEEGMPDLFMVHFHGIDDMGHEVGPGAELEKGKIREVDAAVGTILEKLPPGTLVIIFADHGMHTVEGQERLGNHGHLIPRDMLIPIWVFQVES